MAHELARLGAGDVELADEPGRVLVLVMADGSARRGEKAPGYLDERAFAYDRETGRTGCQFQNLEPRDISTLRHIITSHLAGDIVGVGDVLATLQRDFELQPLPDKDGLQWVQATPRQKEGQLTSMKVGFRGDQLAALDILDSFGDGPLISVRPSPANPDWGGPATILNIGIGDNIYNDPGESGANVFGSAALYFTQQISVLAEHTGRFTNAGASIAPFQNLGLTILSGTNKDFGTRCTFSDAELWEVTPDAVEGNEEMLPFFVNGTSARPSMTSTISGSSRPDSATSTPPPTATCANARRVEERAPATRPASAAARSARSATRRE